MKRTIKAKKSYGQHFLTNEGITQDIADSLSMLNIEYSHILEIGPGKGQLTKYLFEKPAKLRAIEADSDMIQFLNERFPLEKDSFVKGNVLNYDFSAAFNGLPFGLIGNFPYNISSQIVFRMIEYRDYVPEMIGMFQQEMAQRIISPPGSKKYGVISVLTQAYYKGIHILKVAPSNFSPPPKVQSSVIRLLRKSEQENISVDYSKFKKVVKTAFMQRRKMLRNTLKSLVNDENVLKDNFFNQRPEVLSVEDFENLTKLIYEKKN